MFTQRCCIWKNTKKLKSKLEDLGYKICCCTDFKDAIILNNCILNGTIHGVGYFDESSGFVNKNELLEQYKKDLKKTNTIDCGVNEQLFLALAALNDENDYCQWFTDNENWYINKSKKGNCDWFLFDKPKNFHKATVDELIEHFK